MEFQQEQQAALHLLHSIENGTSSIAEIGHLIDEADPALVYLVVTWLRARYGKDHPAAEGVIGRLVELTNRSGTLNAKMQEGKEDAVVSWFEEEYSYRDLSDADFVALIVDKLES